jgi:hypothetical protein
MATPRLTDPALLVIAAFSRQIAAVEWAQDRLSQIFGRLAFISIPFEFTQTRYYEAEMGAGLRKYFLVMNDLVDPDRLADIKLQTNALEAELARSGRFPEQRPLNLDPGLLSLGKFILATTKDQSHRIPLREGIHAEVTLRFQSGRYEPWPWTYADYQLPFVRQFLAQAREWYRHRMEERSSSLNRQP